MKKVYYCIVLIAAVLACLSGMTGCGERSGQEEGSTPKELVPTGEYIPVAEFEEVRVNLAGLQAYEWIGDRIVYLENEWDAAQNINNSQLLSVAIDGTGTPEVLAENSGDGSYIWAFFADRAGNLYLMEFNPTQMTDRYFLRKMDAQMQEVYRVNLDEAYKGVENGFVLNQGFADAAGNVALIDCNNGTIAFVGKEGTYKGQVSAYVTSANIVDAGEKGCYLWTRDWEANSVSLKNVDLENGSVSDAQKTISLASMDIDTTVNFTILSGYEQGIFLSTEKVLWQYDPESGEAKEFLQWIDSCINVEGANVAEIRVLEEQEDAGQQPVEALIYAQWGGVIPEIAHIKYMDRGYVPERKTITIGTSIYAGYAEKLARRFNRSNMEYEAIIQDYDVDALMDALMYGREVPDLIDIRYVTADLLESKNLLEDLTPYFDRSEVVGREDILEAVWSCLESDGKVTSMATGFDINTLVTTAENVPEDGWDYDAFFALDKADSESRLLNYYNRVSVWNVVSATVMEQFIDWDGHKCCFDGDEFKALLQKVNGLNYPDTDSQSGSRITNLDDVVRKFLAGEFMVYQENYHTPYDCQKSWAKYGNKVKNAGYPNAEGKLMYLFSPYQQLAIYSNSPEKDGAWAFIEFALSGEEQSWYGDACSAFPVRKDAFEAFLMKPYSLTGNYIGDNPSEENADRIRNMVEHLYSGHGLGQDEISSIIWEEMEAYFAGDKTVDEAAGIIQNRVQLYLDENR